MGKQSTGKQQDFAYACEHWCMHLPEWARLQEYIVLDGCVWETES